MCRSFHVLYFFYLNMDFTRVYTHFFYLFFFFLSLFTTFMASCVGFYLAVNWIKKKKWHKTHLRSSVLFFEIFFTSTYYLTKIMQSKNDVNHQDCRFFFFFFVWKVAPGLKTKNTEFFFYFLCKYWNCIIVYQTKTVLSKIINYTSRFDL